MTAILKYLNSEISHTEVLLKLTQSQIYANPVVIKTLAQETYQF